MTAKTWRNECWVRKKFHYCLTDILWRSHNISLSENTMKTIESLVSELNDLCKQYIAQNDQFQGRERMKELFLEIKDRGYGIVAPILSSSTPEYELLSEEGKKKFDEVVKVRKMKMAAIKDQEFERAADLRDLERELERKICVDFSQNNEDHYFILAGKIADFIVFNDPDNLLIALLK